MPIIEPRIPKGMRDLEPSDMVIRNRILNIIRRTFEVYGYEPIETPALEYWEILTGKYGQEAERLVYHLTDQGGRQLGLRYDLTVPLARYVAARKHLHKPFKRFQIQPVWRAEKPQKGRYREFYQCDVDAVGSASMLVDAELVTLTVDVMRKIGFSRFHVMINNRKILQAIVQKAGIDNRRTADICQSLDKFDKIGLDAVEKELLDKGYAFESITTFREILALQGDNQSLLEKLRILLTPISIGLEGVTELEELLQGCVSMQVPPEYLAITPRLTRGLDYYTGPIYETVQTDRDASSLGGGGRYNGLVGIFSDVELPAAGTSFGLDRIAGALRELEGETALRTTTQVLVTLFSAEMVDISLTITALLRQAGIKTEVVFDPMKLKKQFALAGNRGIPLVIIIGPDEMASSSVQIKDMLAGQQVTVLRRDLVTWIETWLAEHQTTVL